MAMIIGAIGTAISSIGVAAGGTGAFGASIGALAGTAGAAGAAGAGISGLSTVFSIGSGLAAIGQGAATARRNRTEAAQAGVNASEETLVGAEKARDLAREYASLRSEQTVIQLANGLDIGVGTPVNIAAATSAEATRSISNTRENALNRSRIQRLRQRGLLSEARSAFAGGLVKAGTIGLNQMQLVGD